MRRRAIYIVLSVIVVAAAIVGAVMLRKRAAPEPARLLPEADGYLYFDLKPLRTVGVIGKNPPNITDPDYEVFVRETGFQFERDLDEAAFAVHAPPRLMDVEPAPGTPEPFRRFSEVFRGHWDTQRAAGYFRKIASRTETYREVEIYSIPLEGRTVRVALLGVGMAAVSNTDGPQAIHFIIDRYKELALPFGGPSLVRDFYPRVPLGSLVWGIMRTTPQAKGAGLMLPGGFDLAFPADTVIVGSVRYTTAIQLKAEVFTAGPGQAKQIVDQANAFLTIFHGLEAGMNPSGADPDVKTFFSSLNVEQEKAKATLSATVPVGFLKKAFAEPLPQAITNGTQEERPKADSPKPRRRGRGK